MKYLITRDIVPYLTIEADWICPEQEANPDGCEDCETITHPDLPGVVIKNKSYELEGPEALQNLLREVYQQAYSKGFADAEQAARKFITSQGIQLHGPDTEPAEEDFLGQAEHDELDPDRDHEQVDWRYEVRTVDCKID